MLYFSKTPCAMNYKPWSILRETNLLSRLSVIADLMYILRRNKMKGSVHSVLLSQIKLSESEIFGCSSSLQVCFEWIINVLTDKRFSKFNFVVPDVTEIIVDRWRPQFRKLCAFANYIDIILKQHSYAYILAV